MASEKYRKDGQHLPLNTLKQELLRENKFHKRIMKEDIPTYPRPELHVSHVSHNTDLWGLLGIMSEWGFGTRHNPNDEEPRVVWFSLTVSPAELREAEDRDMTLVHPGGQEEQFWDGEGPWDRRGQWGGGAHWGRRGQWDRGAHWGRQGQWDGGAQGQWDGQGQRGGCERVKLKDFASSPAFRSRSRYGPFRFTFSLRDVLDKYSQQFCAGQKPVLRVYRTVLYPMEVMYAVLVHSPDNNGKFSQYPLLEETPHCICAFSATPQPHFVWRPQAMSGTHRFGLFVNEGNVFTEEYVRHSQRYYVWDNVALALHVGQQILEFEDHELRDNLRFCEKDDVTVPKGGSYVSWLSFEEAQDEFRNLWRHHNLQKFKNSHFHINY